MVLWEKLIICYQQLESSLSFHPIGIFLLHFTLEKKIVPTRNPFMLDINVTGIIIMTKVTHPQDLLT